MRTQLLADPELASVANPLSLGQPPPSLRYLEGRAVQASFLRKFVEEKVTQELKEIATEMAIPYLEAQIARRKQEISDLVAEEKTRSTAATAIDGAELVRGRSDATQSADERRRLHAIKLTNANRWLGWLTMDLERRRHTPYCTARDVHRLIVKPETDELQCRYCELPGLREEKDPETGMYFFGDADHFFSYNWDSPIDDVEDAISTHSAEMVVAGKAPPYYWIDNFAINQHERTDEEGARKQRDDPGSDESWRMSSVACAPCAPCQARSAWAQCDCCPCAACRARSDDLPDWERVEVAAENEGEALGFERVIRHTRSTAMLMEPWHRPRAPTRVWCLFEGNATLQCGGKLQAILGSRQQLSLQRSLTNWFGKLEQIVSSLDCRTADATGEEDKRKIFAAIERLPGGYAELDGQVQTALRSWLADAAEGVLRRTDPRRPALSGAEMELELVSAGKGRWCCCCFPCCFWPRGSKASRLVERWPRLPAVLQQVGLWTMVGFMIGMMGWMARFAAPGAVLPTDPPDGLLWSFAVAVSVVLYSLGLGKHFIDHQKDRQLRRPAFVGPAAHQRRRALAATWITLTSICLPLTVLYFLLDSIDSDGWESSGKSMSDTVIQISVPFLAFCIGLYTSVSVKDLLEEPGQVATPRARLCVQVGWLRLALGEAEAALVVFHAAHEEMHRVYGSDDVEGYWHTAGGLARALCEAGRGEEVAELAQQVADAAERHSGSWRRHLRPRSRYGPFSLFLELAGASRARQWQERSALLQARIKAAVRAPDGEVFDLLEVAAKTEYGEKYVLDADIPEMAEFLRRMRDDTRADPSPQQERWQALPPLMRSGGENAISSWKKLTCESRTYFVRKDPDEQSLTAPPEGVRQKAQIGMSGLDITRSQWESQYRALDGPDSLPLWRIWALKAKEKKPGNKLLLFCAVIFCLAFVYVDCGEHGTWGVGSCTCVGNFAGDRCESECHCGGVALNSAPTVGSCGGVSCSTCEDMYEGEFCQLAPAYVISGAARSCFNGQYLRLEAECNDKPVYKLGGSGGYVLFQPTDTSKWMVRQGGYDSSCDSSGLISSNGNGGSCEASPDGDGCAGKWRENTHDCEAGAAWCNNPSFAVSTCPVDEPCCGIDCDEHGTLTGDGNIEQCGCSCSGDFVGDLCQLAPAYVVSGAARSRYNGQYLRLEAECNDKPVYELGGSGGYVLFQPTDTSKWMVRQGGYDSSCDNIGAIESSGNGGACEASPDGDGCAGKWREYTHDCEAGADWCNNPSFAVSTCPVDEPCCGIDCGEHGTLTGDGNTEQCGCSCSGDFVGDLCQLAPAYVVSGAARSRYNGQYLRLEAECNDKPVYELGGSGKQVLFQPTDTSKWMVRPGRYDSSCDNIGAIESSGNGGSCEASPDGDGCVGKWREYTHDCEAGADWCNNPSLAVAPPLPACDDSCRPGKGTTASANNGVCEERGLADAVCHADRTCDCPDGTDGTDCAALRPCQIGRIECCGPRERCKRNDPKQGAAAALV